jgi:hypothetical protein
LRLLKKFFLFAAELLFFFLGFIFSLSFAAYLDYWGNRFALIGFLLGFSIFCAVLVWIRRKTGKWTIAADAKAWLAYRSWRQIHPRRAKYLRILHRTFLWFPSICGAIVLFFLPVASHIRHPGTHVVPHYRFSIPLNCLIIKSSETEFVRTFFSNQGAARYGFTPIWFTRSVPSYAVFAPTNPDDADRWPRPEEEIVSRHITHVSVRKFQLGMIGAACYEYPFTGNYYADFSPSMRTPPVMWESDCSTKPNGVDYNLRASFVGYREDLPTFYDLLNSATPDPDN